MQNRVVGMMTMLAIVGSLGAVGVSLHRSRPPSEAVLPGGAPVLSPAASSRATVSAAAGEEQIRIHVAGAVRQPGVYSLPLRARVIDAVKQAGGATSRADLDAINLADRLRDGEQVRIPARGRREQPRAHRPAPEPAVPAEVVGGHALGRSPFGSAETPRAAVAGGPVRVNSATAAELDTLPGVGPATAAKIIAYREQHGPFQRAEDLMNVSGIGPAKLARMQGQIEIP